MKKDGMKSAGRIPAAGQTGRGETFIRDAIIQVLEPFYRLTGIPVLFYIGKSLPVIAVPEKGEAELERWQRDHEEAAEVYLQMMRESEESGQVVTKDRRIAVGPMLRDGLPQGYLVLDTEREEGSEKEERFQAAVSLLPVLAEYIVAHGLKEYTFQTYIDLFHQFVYDHADTDLSVDTVATFLNISKTTLYEQFHMYVQMPFARYIKKVRLEKACFLLAQTDLKIMEISEMVGFNDYNYFCRTFKKEIGMPALRYRKLHMAAR